jgi:hypothetical protein
MTSTRRTEFAPFVIDLLDFMEEKIGEAVAEEASRVGAISEAVGVVPLMRGRLSENEDAQAQFILVFDNEMYDADAAKCWKEFARMDRAEFEQQAADLLGPQGAGDAARGRRNEPSRPPLGRAVPRRALVDGTEHRIKMTPCLDARSSCSSTDDRDGPPTVRVDLTCMGGPVSIDAPGLRVLLQAARPASNALAAQTPRLPAPNGKRRVRRRGSPASPDERPSFRLGRPGLRTGMSPVW